jgi:hypothetical protein
MYGYEGDDDDDYEDKYVGLKILEYKVLEILSFFSQFNLRQLFQNKTPNKAYIPTGKNTDFLCYEVSRA